MIYSNVHFNLFGVALFYLFFLFYIDDNSNVQDMKQKDREEEEFGHFKAMTKIALGKEKFMFTT